MRAPDDMPSRRSRRAPRTGRGRTWLVVGAVLLFFLITSLRGIASFYTDYLWYDSLGQAAIWRGVLGAKIALTVIFTVAFFVLMWINLVIADRLAPPFRPAGPEDEVIERYHELVGGRVGVVRASVAGLLALIAGAGVSSEWNSWILFTHARDFGIDDPQFNTDIGFYVFRLPFLTFLVGWLFAASADRADRHDRRPLPQRWHPDELGAQPGHPPGEGAPVGAARPARAGEGGGLLAPAL